MYRQARERIITAEVRKLERRQAVERAKRDADGPPRAVAGVRSTCSHSAHGGERCPARR